MGQKQEQERKKYLAHLEQMRERKLKEEVRLRKDHNALRRREDSETKLYPIQIHPLDIIFESNDGNCWSPFISTEKKRRHHLDDHTEVANKDSSNCTGKDK